MGQYAKIFTSASIVKPSNLAPEFLAISTAFNSHATGDFSPGLVPLSGIVSGNAYFTMSLYCGYYSTATPATCYTDNIVMPVDATLVNVSMSVSNATLCSPSSKVCLYVATPTTYSPIIDPVEISEVPFTYNRIITLRKTMYSIGDIINMGINVTASGTNMFDQVTASFLFKKSITA
jgi:hypothetical protein